jgi:hypothetical protein
MNARPVDGRSRRLKARATARYGAHFIEYDRAG